MVRCGPPDAADHKIVGARLGEVCGVVEQYFFTTHYHASECQEGCQRPNTFVELRYPFL